jgi:hypothetical protein
MRTYRVAPLSPGTEGWTVIRIIPGEADEILGHYSDRAEAQSECARLVVEEAELQDAQRNQSDTRYQIFQEADAYKVRITRLGSLVQQADGFESRVDAESWIAQAKRFGAVRAGQPKPINSPHLKVVKP